MFCWKINHNTRLTFAENRHHSHVINVHMFKSDHKSGPAAVKEYHKVLKWNLMPIKTELQYLESVGSKMNSIKPIRGALCTRVRAGVALHRD
jgi:hypothetical protein